MSAITKFFTWLSHSDEVVPNRPVFGIEIFNRQATRMMLRIDPPFCIEVELAPEMEYRVEMDDTEYRIEFDGEWINLYPKYQSSARIYKRPHSTDIQNHSVWELIEDYWFKN